MNKINLRDVPEFEQRSPTGKFHSFAQNVSLALGGIRNVGVWGGGHPFDFQVRRIPPGAAVCPYHAHIVQWEMFVVRRGTGTVRVGEERREVRAGDCFLHPPGEPHQLINTGAEDVEVFIVADNPQLDGFYYPDSKKWGLRTPNVFFKMAPVDYFEGEDTVVDAPAPAPALTPPATPFAARCKHLDDIAWEDWQSPKGKFRGSFRGISLAFGAQHRTPVGLGGHPFDLELGRVPPGATLFPFHWHALQWEFYVFLEGCGEFRLGDATFAVEPGDCVMAAPGVGHGFRNAGVADLLYFVVADDPLNEFWCYADSNKFGFPKPRKIFRAVDVAHFTDDEE
ncbi:MAG: cupin domain-containing protein [Opitutae bacterium]|nr:cupin domain-containing protein [Opitutae bacterium]